MHTDGSLDREYLTYIPIMKTTWHEVFGFGQVDRIIGQNTATGVM